VRPFVPATVRAVVEAYGNTEAVVEVAVNEPANAFTPRSDEPFTESLRHGDVVPKPMFPAVETKIDEVAVRVVPFAA
jgi:acyl-CoA synthetase (AMP-forming)/AMP-acid ligase II